MIKLYRDILKAIEPMVKQAGGTARVESAAGKGKHMKLVIDINGKTKSSPLACTPKLADFAVQHKINDVRKILKELSSA